MSARSIASGPAGTITDKIKSMNNYEEPFDTAAEVLIADIRDRARNLYQSRRMLCTEAVLFALNRELNGGLTDSQALTMAAPFCVALGDSGCLCGALSGAVMASGLLLGKERPYRRRRAMRESARELHDAFKAANGATCCRMLSKSVKHDRKAHFRQCAGLTAYAAELAARLVLRQRPELITCVDSDSVTKRQSGIATALSRIVRYFLPAP
jgi:C_GCAxxG_C_C family probable redox protein